MTGSRHRDKGALGNPLGGTLSHERNGSSGTFAAQDQNRAVNFVYLGENVE